MKLSKCKWYTYNTFAFFSTAAFMIALIPFVMKNGREVNTTARNIIAGIFWISLIFGCLTIRGDKRAMDGLRRKMGARGRKLAKRKPGIITFSRKKKHIFVYAACAVCIILCIGDAAAGFFSDKISLPLTSAAIILFAYHCLIDGKNYRTLKLLIKILEERYENDQ